MSRVIAVKGVEVEVKTPYAEGHTLTEMEAKVLNQTFSENVRNRVGNNAEFQSAVKAGDTEAAARVAQPLADTYEFGQRTGGGGGRSADPYNTCLRQQAVKALKGALADAGYKGKKDYDADKGEGSYIAKVHELMAHESIIAQTKTIMAAQEKSTGVDISV